MYHTDVEKPAGSVNSAAGHTDVSMLIAAEQCKDFCVEFCPVVYSLIQKKPACAASCCTSSHSFANRCNFQLLRGLLVWIQIGDAA